MSSNESKNKTKVPEILIHPLLKKEIAKECKTSDQTVMMSIKYVYNSELAIKIRQLAQKKMIEEANKITF